jgi:hypothetical protein
MNESAISCMKYCFFVFRISPSVEQRELHKQPDRATSKVEHGANVTATSKVEHGANVTAQAKWLHNVPHKPYQRDRTSKVEHGANVTAQAKWNTINCSDSIIMTI